MANSVTALYYLIDAATGKDALVEGGEIDRPPWLGFSVHIFNSIVAWADICCAHPRSFSKRSGRLSVGVIAFYTIWILICSHFNGAFPYPILNQLPWPTVSIHAKHMMLLHRLCLQPSKASYKCHGICPSQELLIQRCEIAFMLQQLCSVVPVLLNKRPLCYRVSLGWL